MLSLWNPRCSCVFKWHRCNENYLIKTSITAFPCCFALSGISNKDWQRGNSTKCACKWTIKLQIWWSTNLKVDIAITLFTLNKNLCTNLFPIYMNFIVAAIILNWISINELLAYIFYVMGIWSSPFGIDICLIIIITIDHTVFDYFFGHMVVT